MRSRARAMGILAMAVALGGCTGNSGLKGENDLLQARSRGGDGAKKVILLVADSLMAQSIDRGMRSDLLPSFRYLIENGQYYPDVVSSFPTMSISIDSTIVTGEYPDKHHVPGLAWYSTEEQRVVNYGTGPMEAFRTGGKQVLTDLVTNLNGKHLNARVSTIYEDLADRGLTSGSVNGLIYRGKTEHNLRLPDIVRIPLRMPEENKVRGPDFFSFGDFSNPLEGITETSGGVTNKWGFNNDFAMKTVKQLVYSDRLPDFLYVYLPDLDQRLHKKGPADLEGVRKLDGQLRLLLQAFGSPEEALKKAVILIVGDSGMSAVLPAERQPVVDLPALLHEYAVLKPGERVTDRTEIALAVNETSAYVYSLKEKELPLLEIAARLRADYRIGVIAWKENGWIRVLHNGIAGEFRFREKGEWTDSYGQTWTWEGNPSVLDIRIEGTKKLSFKEYPDALQRLYSAMHSHPGSYLLTTSNPGYELTGHSSPKHKGGGGHGSLHRKESLVPLIVCGTDLKPQGLRLVDLKEYMMKLLPAAPLMKP